MSDVIQCILSDLEDTVWFVVSLKTSNTEFSITQFNPTLLHAECSSRSSQHKGQASNAEVS